MGEAKNRQQRAAGRISEAACDAISEATATAISRALTPIIHAALMAELVERMRQGEDMIMPHRLPVGVETGVMLTLLAVVWGYLPPTARKQDLVDAYRALVPVMVEGLTTPPGQLVTEAMSRARAGMH